MKHVSKTQHRSSYYIYDSTDMKAVNSNKLKFFSKSNQCYANGNWESIKISTV